MAKDDSKIYYWAKGDKDYFEEPRTLEILSHSEGQLNCVALVLFDFVVRKSLQTNGTLFDDNGNKFQDERIFRVLHIDGDLGKSALRLLLKLEKLARDPKRNLVVCDFFSLVGSETGEARRLREARNRKKAIEASQKETNTGFIPGSFEPVCTLLPLGNPLSLESFKSLQSAQAFESFLKKYPRQENLEEALQWLSANDPSTDEVEAMGIALDRDMATRTWFPPVGQWLQMHKWTDKDVAESKRRAYEESLNQSPTGAGGKK